MIRRTVIISLLALGFGCSLLAGSVAFVEDLLYSGQQLYWMTVTPVETVSSTDSVLIYSELPPVVQKAFDAARQNQRYDLWSETDRDVLAILRDHEYIRHKGQYYRYELGSEDRDWETIWMIVLTFGIIGVVLTQLGIRRWRA